MSSKHQFRTYVNFRLEQVARSAREAADRVYRRECGLDVQHIRILRIVTETPNQPVNIVVRESMLDRSQVSRIISALVRRKLIKRTISPEDARQYLLLTTSAGENLVRKAHILGETLNRDLLNLLDDHEIEVLERCLAKLATWQTRDREALPAAQ